MELAHECNSCMLLVVMYTVLSRVSLSAEHWSKVTGLTMHCISGGEKLV